MCSVNTLLTKRQMEVYDFLAAHEKTHGRPPSTRDIQRQFQFKSQNAAMNHLRALAKKNFIGQLAGRVWAIKNADREAPRQYCSIPLLGAIHAGHPAIGHQESSEHLNLDLNALGLRDAAPEKLFVLQVRGDSMIGAHILDGDLAVLERKAHRNGDIVAALVDGECSLKRLVIEKKRTFLKAENANYPNIVPMEQLEIQGVLVGLIRQCRFQQN